MCFFFQLYYYNAKQLLHLINKVTNNNPKNLEKVNKKFICTPKKVHYMSSISRIWKEVVKPLKQLVLESNVNAFCSNAEYEAFLRFRFIS